MNDERHKTSEVPTDFKWKEIEEITNDFAPEREIGSGGYGVVYKGVHPNGQEVAVKKLYHMPGLDEDQFQNELRILIRIRHTNIVQLIGKSYTEQDRCVEHQGRLVFATMIDRAICLEFLPEGSLEKHLSDEWSELRWLHSYKIIKGICNGLKYLHGERIFHLDLKPSNILLDKDMEPKIADFGLSRLFGRTRQSHTTKKLLCTLGYAPPEFVDKGKITNKFDIFSLGVIIIKVLAGPNSDKSDSQDFIDLVQRIWRKKLMDRGWEDASCLDAYCNQVKTCTEIALKCMETNSHKRPSIEDIISMLNETEETIDKLYQQLFVVEPSHLCFPFEPDKLIPCPVHVTNNADHDIAYRIQVPNTPDLFVGSLNGMVPARCTQTCVLTMQKQEKPPPNLDIIHIQSVVFDWEYFRWDIYSLSIDWLIDNAEVVHDERKVVKIMSLYECASQLLASKPRIEVLSPNPTHTIEVHPLEPWVITWAKADGIGILNYKTRADELDLSNTLQLKKDVTVVKFIPRMRWLVAGYRDGYIDVYCYGTKQRLKRFEAHESDQIVKDLAVHPTEPYVLSACWDKGNVKLWDWKKKWECTRIFEFDDFEFYFRVTFLNIKDTDTFAFYGDAGIIKICSFRSPGSAEFLLADYKDSEINCFDYFANGDQQYLITGYPDGAIVIWDIHTHNLVETVEHVHTDSVRTICCHSEAEHPVLVTGSDDGTVCLWNPATLRPERTFTFGLGEVNDVKVCMDSSSFRIVVALDEGLAMIEMDRNDPVANTGNSNEENDLAGSRKRKRPGQDRAEMENGENDSGNGEDQKHGKGPTDEEMHSVSSKLLGVYPRKLQLPFKANKLTSCSLKLSNTTDDHVAVRLLTKCPKRYITKMPLCCIVPPKCIYTLIHPVRLGDSGWLELALIQPANQLEAAGPQPAGAGGVARRSTRLQPFGWGICWADQPIQNQPSQLLSASRTG